MHIEFIPIAEASVATLMQSVNRVILNPLILLLFSAALVYFLYGVVQYLINPEDEEMRTTSKSHMIYGVIGMFVMMSVFGIMRLILNSFNENRIRITDNGDISVSQKGFSDIGNPTQAPTGTGGNGESDQTEGGNNSENKEIKNPFKGAYSSDDVCFRISTAVYGQNQYDVLKNVSPTAKKLYAEHFKVDIGTVSPEKPFITTEKGVVQDQIDTSVSPVSYYHWFIAYAPKPGISTSCAVAPMTEAVFDGSNPFVSSDYLDTNTYYNEVDFVVADNLTTDMSTASMTKVVNKIKTDIAPRAYDPALLKSKTKVLRDEAAKKAYYWTLVSYPKNSTSGGFGDKSGDTPDSGGSSSPLALVSESDLSASDPNAGTAIKTMLDKYNTDTTARYNVVASGKSATSAQARTIAIENGRKTIAKRKGASNISAISYNFNEEKLFLKDGFYHSWVAIYSPK